LEQQKDTKRKAYEQSVKEYKEYLEEERKLCEKKKQFKWQVRKDLNDQINFRKNTIVSIRINIVKRKNVRCLRFNYLNYQRLVIFKIIYTNTLRCNFIVLAVYINAIQFI